MLPETKDFINLAVTVNKNGEVLLVRRAKQEKGSGASVLRWAFPGGKLVIGETQEETVVREVLAETGYAVRPVRQLSLRVHPQLPVIVAYYLCELVSEKPEAEPSEPDEIAEVRWVKPEEILNHFTTQIDPRVAKFLGIEDGT